MLYVSKCFFRLVSYDLPDSYTIPFIDYVFALSYRDAL